MLRNHMCILIYSLRSGYVVQVELEKTRIR